jgi:predicted AAA+ superfamily ATPase
MTPKNNVNSTFDAQSDFKKIEESEIKKLEKQIEDLESQLIKKIKKEFESDKDNKSTFNINESVRIICGITAIIFCVMYDHLAVALLLALFVFG